MISSSIITVVRYLLHLTPLEPTQIYDQSAAYYNAYYGQHQQQVYYPSQPPVAEPEVTKESNTVTCPFVTPLCLVDADKPAIGCLPEVG
jgi:hypothetical protein